ncbi:hypothetical protein UVI_02025250 [Ustilaginoidea virens]|uniref:Uncharacterized protein n=1 Tax=Ustilaginoidea virens TaxID=1159556 RepID=A0A1B5KR34_USTVR|nr:hypothetical protein UVI_02025250 [Ustilaginoidea virens]
MLLAAAAAAAVAVDGDTRTSNQPASIDWNTGTLDAGQLAHQAAHQAVHQAAAHQAGIDWAAAFLG